MIKIWFILFLAILQPLFAQKKSNLFEQINDFSSEYVVNPLKKNVLKKKIIEKALAESKKSFELNIQEYDLNSYKKSPFFIPIRLDHVKDLDFNKTKYQAENKILGTDEDAKIIFIDLGKKILYEDRLQRGDFISFIALYNLEKQEVSKILLYNSGYFLE